MPQSLKKVTPEYAKSHYGVIVTPPPAPPPPVFPREEERPKVSIKVGGTAPPILPALKPKPKGK
jgi:hypothetical protein